MKREFSERLDVPAAAFDNTMALLREGYDFISNGAGICAATPSPRD